MADGAQCLAFVGRHHALRGVFHHEQVIFLRQRHDGIHLAGNAGIVHWHNRAGFIGDRRFDFGFVDVHGIRTQVDEHHFGAAQHKGVGGGNEGKTRHDHFVTRLYIQQDGGHFQRRGAGRRQQHFRAAETLFHPLLAAAGKAAVAA